LVEAGRGAAGLAVLLFHSLNTYPRDGLPGGLRELQPFTEWGWLGVHVFFAISGWCIAERLAKGRRTGESGAHFAAERFLRIYPTYWAALLFLVASRLAAIPFNTARLAGALPVGLSGWLGAAFLAEPYLGHDSYLLVSWSLVFELGFYLCAAMALVAARRRIGGGPTLFLVGSLLCFMPWVAHRMTPPWRVLELWPDFFAGAAAWWAARRGARIQGYGLLALMFATTALWPAYGGIGRLTSIVTALVLALAWPHDRRLEKNHAVRALSWAGGISYSLYLIHLPLISPLENLLGRWVPSVSPWFILVWLSAICLALVGAVCLNRWVEAPVERWRRRAI
jgi:peptidoglycan/LPS O-acetylase OafA/YrhL